MTESLVTAHSERALPRRRELRAARQRAQQRGAAGISDLSTAKSEALAANTRAERETLAAREARAVHETLTSSSRDTSATRKACNSSSRDTRETVIIAALAAPEQESTANRTAEQAASTAVTSANNLAPASHAAASATSNGTASSSKAANPTEIAVKPTAWERLRAKVSPRLRAAAKGTKRACRSAVTGSRHGLVGMGAGLMAVAMLFGGITATHVGRAQAVAAHSVLSSSVLEDSKIHSPKSLHTAQGAVAKQMASARMHSAEEIAANSAALCQGLAQGANSVVSAYVPADSSPIFMPLRKDSYHLTSPFGMRVHPITGVYSLHSGTDMAAPKGTPIHAVADGKVLSISAVGSNNGIVIEHHVNGQVFTSWYLHSYAEDILVQPGDTVKAGEQISSVGSAGRSTGAHLHLEMHPGAGIDTDPVEPLSFLADLGAMWIGQECAIR